MIKDNRFKTDRLHGSTRDQNFTTRNAAAEEQKDKERFRRITYDYSTSC